MKTTILLLMTIFISQQAYGASRFAFLAGFGSGSSTNEKTFNEGPYMLMMKLDVDVLPNWVFGLEHSRALGSGDDSGEGSSDISETSFGMRYHLFNAVSFRNFNQSKSDTIHFSLDRRGLSPYMGAGIGFASSGSKDEEKAKNNALSLTLKFKGGLHWQISHKYGVDIDGSYTLPIAGNGEIVFMTVGFGLYYNF